MEPKLQNIQKPRSTLNKSHFFEAVRSENNNLPRPKLLREKVQTVTVKVIKHLHGQGRENEVTFNPPMETAMTYPAHEKCILHFHARPVQQYC